MLEGKDQKILREARKLMQAGIKDLLGDMNKRGVVHVSDSAYDDEFPFNVWCEITPLAAGACRVLVTTHNKSVTLLAGPRSTGFDFYYDMEGGMEAAIAKALSALRSIRDGRLVETCWQENGAVYLKSELPLDDGDPLVKEPYKLPDGREPIDTPVAPYEPVRAVAP